MNFTSSQTRKQLALRVLLGQNSMGVQTVVVVNFKRTTNSRYKVYGARKFRFFTNTELTRATSFAWAKLYGRADCCSCKFQTHNQFALQGLWRSRISLLHKHGSSSRYEFCLGKTLCSVQTVVVVNFKRTTSSRPARRPGS